MVSTAAGLGIVGRERELVALGALLDQASGSGCATVLRGDPGVGKSALLDAVAAEASGRGWCVLRTDGTPAERFLPLAGLHKLLRPVRADIARLRGGRREALEGAFGSPEAASDVFRVSLACLDLWAALAATAPLAVLVDDAQWLDRSSTEVLAFTARRLATDPVLVLAASREVGDDPLGEAGVADLLIGPLDGRGSSALLDRTSPGLPAATRSSVLSTAAGNPLGLLELPLSADDGSVGGVPDGLVPLTRRLEQAFAGRVADLPKATGDLLLVAAVGNPGDLEEVLAAAELLAGSARSVGQLDPAASSGLARVGADGVRFRHPLVRSAVYQSAPLGRRHAVHAALAEVVADADRRAWHRAAAALGPNEEVAGELEQVAARARRRGSVSGALLALERAVHLSASGVARGRRLLAAAELAAEAGRSAVARAWLDRSRSLLTDPRDRLRAEVVAEVVDESMQGGAARVDALIGMSERALREGEEDVAVRLVLGAARRCWHMDFGADVERRVVTAADRARGDRRDPRLVLVRAFASPFDRAADVVAELHHRLPAPDDDPADLLMLGFAGACVGAYSEAEVFCAAAATALREQGRLALLAEALSLLTWATLRRGRWQVASPAADECVRLSREIGQPIQEAAGLAAQAMIAGIRGDDGADELAAQAEALATATRNTIGLAVTCLARGVIAAGQGRPEQSFEHLWRLYQPSDPAHQRMQACRSLGHLAEVAVATGHVGEARVELARFEPLVAATPAEGVHVAVGYARAVLAGPEAADDAFAAALDRNWGDWSFEHGRLLLAYGGWLRRHQRVRESRVHLRGALDEFVRAGARPWAERARRELRAAGEASVALRGDAWERLSPQEAQIARLVLEGLGNKEIGQRLYLSHRTVGSHLYRMFPKVGVSSRAQLVHLLAQAPVEDEERPGTGPDVGRPAR